ncbi:MAG: endonuclease/exonuclease/phosphatase family protein [Bacteroides sp.]|nr:endonuclease/exonuclease/phosphatase family protein [Bacteroides sp.]
MKKLLCIAAAALLCLSCAENEKKVNVKWATFNMRLDTPYDSLNSWQYRKERVAEFINRQALDIFGTQEVLQNQFDDLKNYLPDYEGIGVARDDGKQSGEYSAIFYRKDKFDVMDSNTFWLSEYPDSVGLKGWDAACVRVATWAKLKDKTTGKIFMAVNTHFDHVGVEARKQSALLIIDKIKEIVGDKPAVLTGDFNVTDDNEAYATITTNEFVLQDAYRVAAEHTGVDYTFHNYARLSPEEAIRIDFIFVTPQIKVLSVDIPQEVPGQFLSDHNPQIAELEF